MSFIGNLSHTITEAYVQAREQQEQEQIVKGRKQVLDGDTVDDFLRDSTDKPSVPPRTIEETRKRLTILNAVRMARIQKDFRWMQKQMKNMGLNPEDARYLL